MLHLYVIQRAPKISETMLIGWSQEYYTLETLKRRTSSILSYFGIANDQTCFLASCHSEGSPLCLSLALSLGTASWRSFSLELL